jgi:FkbM family methyltransferase
MSSVPTRNELCVSNLISALTAYGFEIKGGTLVLPSWVQRIKIDVGLAFNAPNSEIWLRDRNDLLVFGFEPIPENFQMLAAKEVDHDLLRINPSRIGVSFFPLQFAVGTKPGFTEMYITDQDLGCSSILEPKAMSVSRREAVEVVRLDELLAILPWERISIVDHVKTDCQGTDLDVVKSAGEYLRKVLAVTIEPDDYTYEESQNSYVNITSYFKRYGFVNQESPSATLSILSQRTSKLTWLKPLKKTFRKIVYSNSGKQPNLPDSHDPTFVNEHLRVSHGEALGYIQQKG